jgi:hypothetical protein
MRNLIPIVGLAWAIHGLWRWTDLAMGLLLVAHGLFSKNMRMRDNRTLLGVWRGKIVTKPWQVLFMRTFLW